MTFRLALVFLLLSTTLACAGRSWNAAQREDTAAGYARFLRENPDSEFAAEAKAHLAFVRARSKPTRQAYQDFEKRFPGHALVAELRPYVEESFFDSARAAGTVKAYQDFVTEFPSGRFTARARGNLAFLEAGGFPGRPSELTEFVASHPDSDYATEAERSLAAIEARGASGFGQVGLVLDVPADVPNADRLRRLFAERAVATYQASGVPLLTLGGDDDPRGREVGAILRIAHREREMHADFGASAADSVHSMLGETRVTLGARGGDAPIWDDTLKFRIPFDERGDDQTVLLHPRAWSEFWERDFFVPVARWDTRAARRAARSLGKPPVDVEVRDGRTTVLFGDGDFRILDLSDPEAPVELGGYERPRDLSHFSGVVSVPGGVAVFGPDGIEVVRQGPKGPVRATVHGRDAVGSVVAVERIPGGLVAAGNRGLLWLGDDGSQATWFPREVLGLARHGKRLLFTDGTSLYVAAPSVLKRGRIEAEMRLGRGFRPGMIHHHGGAAIVLGEPGLVWVDVRNPVKPRIVSRIEHVEVGEVRDAAVVGGRIYLLGARGLQISDPSGERIVDSVDVDARHRIGAWGRHVVLIGEDHVQVVDTSAFGVSPAASR